MIGRIQGELLGKYGNTVLIDVRGIGYEVDAPLSVLCELPGKGGGVTLYTHFVVREDAQQLYGFMSLQDRDFFRLLIKVNGVGPKMAVTIMSGMSVLELADCFMREDVTQLVKLPGVGKKTAERLVIEMKDKLKQLSLSGSIGEQDLLSSGQQPLNDYKARQSEAEAALLALGYKPAEAKKAIAAVANEGLSVEQIIRDALKGMVKG